MTDNTEAIALLPHCMTEALDQLLPGEVYVATGGSQNCAAWGEILTATARTRGAIGARQNRCAAKTVQIDQVTVRLAKIGDALMGAVALLGTWTVQDDDVIEVRVCHVQR